MILLNGQELNFKTFPNGETLVDGEQIDNIEYILREEVYINEILFKYENDSDLIKLMFLKKHLDNICYNTLTFLTIAYMPYSRMDRVEGDSVFTLKYVTDFINSLNFDSVMVTEPHSDVSCALLNKSFANYPTIDLLDKVKAEIDFDDANDFLFFPDLGANRRYKNVTGYNQLIGHKVRDFKTGKIKSLDVIGDASGLQGRKVCIIDDLSSFGNTFVMSADKLYELGASEIYLFVTHAEHSIFKGSLFSSHINKVFTTNTIINEVDVPEAVKPLIKIFDVIGGK